MSTQTPIQWLPQALSPKVKRLGREAKHAPTSSAEVWKSDEPYLHSLIRLHGVHRDSSTFPLKLKEYDK